jgi:hypothetical protein
MQEGVAWNKNQQARVQSYKPQKPELPTDFACPPGQCTTEPPPPPAGIEAYTNLLQERYTWPLIISTASIIFILLTHVRK